MAAGLLCLVIAVLNVINIGTCQDQQEYQLNRRSYAQVVTSRNGRIEVGSPEPAISFAEYDEDDGVSIVASPNPGIKSGQNGNYRPYQSPGEIPTNFRHLPTVKPMRNVETREGSSPALETLIINKEYLTDPRSPVQKVVTANNGFTQNYYKIIASKNSLHNFVFSPFSIITLLGMLRAGAHGKTLTEIQTAMNARSSSDELYSGFQGLCSNLQSNAKKSNTTFITSNRLFIQRGFNLQLKFQEILKNQFKAPAQQLDFAGPNAEAVINEAVSQDTHNLINNLVEPGILSNYTRLLALSVLYFKGAWENPFHGRATKKRDFFTLNGQVTPVEMMSTEDYFRTAHLDHLKAKAVSLPYVGKQMEMIILLPNEKYGLPEMEQKLFAEQNYFTRIVEKLKGTPKNIFLYLPKFSMETSQDLQEPLRMMGMQQAFEQFKADFSRIAENVQDLYLSKALQKAYLNLNEAGSEAGAASYGAVFTPLSIGPPIEDTIKIDHPFLGFIRHVDTNLILFAFRKTE